LKLKTFDPAGTLITETAINDESLIIQTAADNQVKFGAKILFSDPNSGATPVGSFQVWCTSEHALTTSQVQIEVTASSPTSDITNRPVHYAVLDGVNAGGSLSVRASACITGVPDSTNAFIANISRDDADVINYADVDELLRQTTRGMQHAFIGNGKKEADEMLNMILASDAFRAELQAFSFRKIGHTLKKVYKGAKNVRRVASEVAKEAKPIMREGGMLLQMTGDPRLSAVGRGLEKGAQGIDFAQKEGILQK